MNLRPIIISTVTNIVDIASNNIVISNTNHITNNINIFNINRFCSSSTTTPLLRKTRQQEMIQLLQPDSEVET
eukprot:gene9965-2141_t